MGDKDGWCFPRRIGGQAGRWGGLVILGFLTLILLSACQMGGPPRSTPHQAVPAGPATPLPVAATWAEYDQAVALYMDGHHEEARALLAAIQQTELTDRQKKLANFLQGITAYKLGLTEEVETCLADPDRIPSSLFSLAFYFRGQAHLGAGRAEAARRLLTEYIRANPDGTWATEAQVGRIEALARLGQGPEARHEARTLLPKDTDGRIRLLLAQLHESAGDRVQARDYYRQAMEKSNFREVRASAAASYRRLLAPALAGPGQEDLKLEYVRFLRQEWHLEEALATVDRLLAQGGGTDYLGRLQGERGTLLLYSGRIQELLPYYQAAAQPGQAKANPQGAWTYAQNLTRLGQWEPAAAAWLVAAEAWNPAPRADEARVEAGLAFLQLGRLDKAEEAFGRLTPAGKTRHQETVTWRRGLFHFRKKSFGPAAEHFATLLKENPTGPKAATFTYWLGRALEEAGRKPEAIEQYRKLAGTYHELYYRMRAEHRLGLVAKADHWADLPTFRTMLALGPPDLDHSFLPLRYHQIVAGRTAWAAPLNGLDDPLMERKKILAWPESGPKGPWPVPVGRWRDLVAAGALDLAVEVGRDLKAHLNQLPGAPPDLAGRLFALTSACLAQVGQYAEFVRLQYGSGQFIQPRTAEETILAGRRYYPLAYPQPLLTASRNFQLHPALLLAVMRTESFYQPEILSVANARGLMQILPATGEKIAARLKQSPPHPEALFAPETNIGYGAWYLSALTGEFDGQFPLAIAAYNAGPFNVRRWVKASGETTIEEFIETIPFDQTRHYVKRVLGDMYMYRLLYARPGQAGSPDLTAVLRPVFRNDINF